MHRISFMFLLLMFACSDSDSDDSLTGSECTGTVDCVGTCDGTAVLDCAGACAGTATEDNCGVCDSDGTNDNDTCSQDCAGVWGGTAPAVANISTGCDLPTSSTTGNRAMKFFAIRRRPFSWLSPAFTTAGW